MDAAAELVAGHVGDSVFGGPEEALGVFVEVLLHIR
jgi:hypothetical protein